MDGWSNTHNEPVVCISVYDIAEKAVYLVEKIETQDTLSQLRISIKFSC